MLPGPCWMLARHLPRFLLSSDLQIRNTTSYISSVWVLCEGAKNITDNYLYRSEYSTCDCNLFGALRMHYVGKRRRMRRLAIDNLTLYSHGEEIIYRDFIKCTYLNKIF